MMRSCLPYQLACAAVILLTVVASQVTVPRAAHAEALCSEWRDARNKGIIPADIAASQLRKTGDVIKDVQQQYGGKVVWLEVCRNGGQLIYKLTVFVETGNVINVEVPAYRGGASTTTQ